MNQIVGNDKYCNNFKILIVFNRDISFETFETALQFIRTFETALQFNTTFETALQFVMFLSFSNILINCRAQMFL